MENAKIGLPSAIFMVLASMIGTGIFGVSGILQASLLDPKVILICWLIGGCIAVAGALCYSEIAANYPLVGGEYAYLKCLYGDLPAFLTGWISIFVGFSAPIAATSYLFAEYFQKAVDSMGYYSMALLVEQYQAFIGSLLVIFLSLIHIIGVKKGLIFQNMITFLKVSIILILLGFGFRYAFANQFETLRVNMTGVNTVRYDKLAAAFLMVSFSFSGWNAAIYLGSEIRDARRNIPKAMLWGTSLTMILYLLVHLMLYATLGVDVIAGENALLAVVAGKVLTKFGSLDVALNVCLCLVLLSSVSVNILLGSRVCFAMGNNIPSLNLLAKTSRKYQTPALAILVQAGIAIAYLLTGSFTGIIIYMGFSLSIFPMLTVGGMWILRRRLKGKAMTYSSPFFPMLPIFFIGSSLLVSSFNLFQNTIESLVSISVIGVGVAVYLLADSKKKKLGVNQVTKPQPST
ncbi:MAG: APC family permease [Oligoflexales bacterium]